jgi:hypothetical protein
VKLRHGTRPPFTHAGGAAAAGARADRGPGGRLLAAGEAGLPGVDLGLGGAGLPGEGVGVGLPGVGVGVGVGLLGPGVGDGGGDTWPVTVQVKFTESVPPDGVLAVTVTTCPLVAAAEIVPLIRPRSLIDRPRGRPAAAKAGGCPALACSDLTCSRIAVPAGSC